MEENAQTPPGQRDYSTISPSAKSLLFLKGHTSIPYAKAAAEQMLLPDRYEPDFTRRDYGFWARTVHFESRYWSIDQLLSDLNIKNILEMSSGFSFRGLASVESREGLYYIDTDLPEVIDTKASFTKAIQSGQVRPGSRLETLPLNALDETAFRKLSGHFPDGPLAIVNEGLLMYLNMDEKEKLCRIIHGILSERGGYWITADIYVKRDLDKVVKIDDRLEQFFKEHKIEEQKFDSFEDAEAFFTRMGFVVDKEAVTDYHKLTAIGYLMQSASEEQINYMRSRGKFQATWRLKVAG